MKIFSAGISTETNTFAPFPTGLDDFFVLRPKEMQQDDLNAHMLAGGYRFLQGLVSARGWELVSSLYAGAEPAGTTVRAAYETLRQELLDDLKAALPVAGVLLDLHGAMVVDGYDDAEGDLIEKVREIVGPDVPLGVELDLHCHLTEKMVTMADIIVTYKEYPHVDALARLKDLFALLADTIEGKIKPTMALYNCRMIGIYRTPIQPVRGIVDDLFELEGKDGVLSVSWGHGFPWGDMPEMGSKLLVVTDNDAAKAQQVAQQVGQRLYGMRKQLQAPTLDVPDAIKAATQRYVGDKPLVIADVTDNAGGGAPSDSTFALREMLAQGVTNAGLAMMWDPIVVQIAMQAGPGATLDVRLGGKMGPTSGDPLDLTVEVLGVVENMMQAFPQGDEGELPSACGDSAALRCNGIDIIVNSLRGQVFGLQVFSNFGLDPLKYSMIVVKSTQHFYAAYGPIAQEVLYMNAPGALTPDYPSLTYRKADLNLYPWLDDPYATSNAAAGAAK
jgi:microcystin degradation protein MlrC